MSTEHILDEIYAWIKTNPSKDELLDYVSALEIPDRLITQEAADYIIRSLYFEKRAVLEDGARDFLEKVSEHDQLNQIINFSRYSRPSVVAHILQFFHVQITQLPADVAQWATSYVSRWNCTLFLATASEYLAQQVYAGSLSNLYQKNLLGVSVPQLVERLYAYAEVIERADERAVRLENAQIQEMRGLLEALALFPKEYLDELFISSEGAQRGLLFRRLCSVSQILAEITAADGNLDIEMYRSAVWNKLRIERESVYLEDIEARRIVLLDHGQDDVFQHLTTVWNFAKYIPGELYQKTLAIFNGLSIEEKLRFREDFRIYLSNSLSFKLLFSSYDLVGFLDQVFDIDRENIDDFVSAAGIDMLSETGSSVPGEVLKEVNEIIRALDMNLQKLKAAQQVGA